MIQLSRRSLVYGVATNDSDYVTKVGTTIKDKETGKPKTTVKWSCPYYSAWKNMLRRCYSKNESVNTAYKDKIVQDEWLTFSNFKRWMEQQYWEGLALDKDIIVVGNKAYGPTVCCFVPQIVNNVLLLRNAKRGALPLGVSMNRGKFGSYASDGKGNTVSLGLFDNSDTAHKAWQVDKARRIEYVINEYAKMACFRTDVAEALTKRVWELRLSAAKGEETFEI